MYTTYLLLINVFLYSSLQAPNQNNSLISAVIFAEYIFTLDLPHPSKIAADIEEICLCLPVCLALLHKL